MNPPRRGVSPEVRRAVARLSPITTEMNRLMKDPAEIDRILAKVSEKGMHSLSRAEQKTLKAATQRQQQRDAVKR